MEGTNFGLNQDFRYYEFFFDSLDCQSSAEQGFAPQDWPLYQMATPVSNLAALKILEVQIPFSFYIFNSDNNRFLLTESNGVTNVNVFIPVGNYSAATLASALKLALDTSSGVFTYTVTFAGQASVPNTGKFTISSNQGGTNTFSLTFGTAGDGGVTNPRLFIGFNAGVNTSSTSQVLTAPNAALVSGPNYLYLNSKQIGPIMTCLLPRGAVNLGNGTAGPQMCKIPINVQPGGIIYWQDPDPLKWFSLENLNLLSQLDLYITIGNNDTPRCTALNGLSFSVKLGILQNNSSYDSQQGPSGGFPGSTVMNAPRKRVRM
jgi:hypothetical protein